MCGACQKEYDHKGRTPVVELDGNFLYREDIRRALPVGLSPADSLQFVNRYIRSWAEDVLLYDKARNNIPNSEVVEQQVANYRKALIMHAYQQELIHQQLSEDVTEDELKAYYQKNEAAFTLQRPLIKGLFIKVPLTAPRIAQVRRWYQQDSQDAVEHLEKYSLQHAVKYEYFYDRWMDAVEVQNWLPLQTGNIENYLGKNRHVELKDTAYYYFLHVTDLLKKGEQEPYESAVAKVRDMLISAKQVQFMQQVKNELYERAEKQNRIKNIIKE